MTDDLLTKVQSNMQKTLEALDVCLSKIRVGRAHPNLLDQVMVDYYGSKTPISQVATINVEDARVLKISPWEKSMIALIEKAILSSNLGITPNTVDGFIRLTLPTLTKQRREELGKLVQNEGEKFRISIRNIRRDSNNECKKLLSTKDISEDQLYGIKDKIQELTDNYISIIDKKILEKQECLQDI